MRFDPRNSECYTEMAKIELLLCEPTDILWSSVIPIVKNNLDTEALKVELPRFTIEVKTNIGHEHLTNNDIDSLILQVYDICPNVKSLVTFLRTFFVASSEAERTFSVMRRIHTYQGLRWVTLVLLD